MVAGVIAKRRALLVALACAATGVPAQSPRKRQRIALLLENDYAFYARHLEAFHAGMRELGYADGRDYEIDRRTAQNDLSRLPALASELVRARPDVFIAPTTPAALAARKATADLPILIVNAGDPVANGLAQTLRRPGGNVTGLTSNSVELYTKRLDLLRQFVPAMTRVAVMYNPDIASDVAALRQVEADCGRLGLQAIGVQVADASRLEGAFETLERQNAQGLLVSNANTNTSNRQRIVELAAKHRLPAVYPNGVYAEAGGLISYAADYPDLYRRVAAYVDKIIKGAKPADLPIEQPTRMELLVNAKTAKAAGIHVPASVRVSADRVIE